MNKSNLKVFGYWCPGAITGVVEAEHIHNAAEKVLGHGVLHIRGFGISEAAHFMGGNYKEVKLWQRDEPEQVYLEGRTAFLTGKEQESNPYNKIDDSLRYHKAWDDGWNDMRNTKELR